MKYRQREGVVQATVEAEIVLMHPDDGMVLVLNEAGTCLWRFLKNWHTMEKVVAAYTAVYQADCHPSREDITAFVTELTRKGLLDVQDV